MERVTLEGGARPWAVATIAMTLVVAGVLTLAQEQPVEAGSSGHPQPNTLGVVSGGKVYFTIQASDDDGLDVFISGNSGSVVSITPWSCSFDDGEACLPGQPTACDAGITTTDPCLQYASRSVDEDNEPDQYTIVVEVTVVCDESEDSDPLITAGDWDVDAMEVVDTSVGITGLDCIPQDEPGFFFVTKEFDGDPEQEFEFRLDTSADLCGIVAPGLLGSITTGSSFYLAGGETAILWCGSERATPWTATVTEIQPASHVAILTGVDCGESDGEENLGEASASLTVSVEGETYIGSANCTFVNSVPDDEDEPAVSNLSATKVCVGEGFDATFEISAAGVTRTAGCGATVSAEVEPGAYEVGEAISGPDADAFTTLIVCNDGTVVQDTSATVTVGPAGLACVVINVFDPDASEDLSDLVVLLPVEIDVEDNNANVVGIDNASANTNANDNTNENKNENTNVNENNNVNTNTQDQTNQQDQRNRNTQTNNIDASPEVNINLAD